jgi:hypothetical protein
LNPRAPIHPSINAKDIDHLKRDQRRMGIVPKKFEDKYKEKKYQPIVAAFNAKDRDHFQRDNKRKKYA